LETNKELEKTYNPTIDWTDNDWNKFEVWLKGMLAVNEQIFVSFIKKDGSERLLRCTLNPKHLPKVEIKEAKRKQPTNTIAVFDLDKKGWRSFTIKSVKKVEFTI
jgi:hypothetical protein